MIQDLTVLMEQDNSYDDSPQDYEDTNFDPRDDDGTWENLFEYNREQKPVFNEDIALITGSIFGQTYEEYEENEEDRNPELMSLDELVTESIRESLWGDETNEYKYRNGSDYFLNKVMKYIDDIKNGKKNIGDDL
jgi:hypothetical protein